MECREINLIIWKGELPIQFVLNPEELSSIEQPDPFFLLTPRVTYLPLVTDKVARHFKQHVSISEQDEIWFEYNGEPLKWHYPIGVLFDMYGGTPKLPWRITAHFKDFPADQLIRCPSKDTVINYFLYRLKESDFLKQHKTKVMPELQKHESKQLTNSILKHKFEEFWITNHKLMTPIESSHFRSIPYKLYTPEKKIIQSPFSAVNEKNEMKTLKDLLDKFYPMYDNNNALKIILHGIEPDVNLPLQWLSVNMSYPDGFLHICIVDTFSFMMQSYIPI